MAHIEKSHRVLAALVLEVCRRFRPKAMARKAAGSLPLLRSRCGLGGAATQLQDRRALALAQAREQHDLQAGQWRSRPIKGRGAASANDAGLASPSEPTQARKTAAARDRETALAKPARR
jgi:hypothetical protein